MAKTEAQKKAQRDFMARGNWKKLSIMARTEDCDLLKNLSDAAGLPVSTYIKRAISAQSGVSFSWDAPRYTQNTQTVEPDEWDRAMIERAKNENDGEAIGIEDLAAELGTKM